MFALFYNTYFMSHMLGFRKISLSFIELDTPKFIRTNKFAAATCREIEQSYSAFTDLCYTAIHTEKYPGWQNVLILIS